MRIYMDKNQNREALEMYREYRKLDPSEELVSRLNDRARAAHYATLGAIHRDVNQMGEADGFFRKALEIYPDNMDYHICRIQVLASQGDIGRAREAAVKWLALKPLKPFEAEECSSQSVAYAVLGDKEKALKYINVSIKKKPKKAIFWATRALIHYYNGDRESFEKDYNHFRSIAQAPEIEYMDTLIRNFKKGYRPAKVPD
jgi:tetratricopeptide (TPR) repeat protein